MFISRFSEAFSKSLLTHPWFEVNWHKDPAQQQQDPGRLKNNNQAGYILGTIKYGQHTSEISRE